MAQAIQAFHKVGCIAYQSYTRLVVLWTKLYKDLCIVDKAELWVNLYNAGGFVDQAIQDVLLSTKLLQNVCSAKLAPL